MDKKEADVRSKTGESIMAKRISTIRKDKEDSKADKFTSHKSNGRRDVTRDGDFHNSLADAKMLRAWRTISENRGVAKNSRSK
ncbi:MAG: hypothetical protein M3430_20395 [Acidobacteriota bacterium]|nr:hypothetical protein [Acidobacteriota bacterium]